MNRMLPLWRRVAMTFGVGRTSRAADESGPVQKLQIVMTGQEVRDGVPSLQLFGVASSPPIGTDHHLAFLSGDRSNGVAIASNHQGYRPRRLAPGEVWIYDAFGRSVQFTAAGGIVVAANAAPVTVNGATTLTINAVTEVVMNTPLLKVSGDIIDNYATNPHTVAGSRAVYDAHTHPVPEVQSGSSTATTSIPTPQE